MMNDYSRMVGVLIKSPVLVLESLTAGKTDMLHMAIGISGESGELLDAVKKHVIYNKPLDRVNMIEELGDLEFYMEGLRQRIGVTRDEVLDANVTKLAIRYAGMQYSDAAAHTRADKLLIDGGN